MAVDFCKHHKGDVVRVHCCDDCARRSGVQPKSPPDSGVGGYYVVYEDGYKSFSPAIAFESGYTRIDG
ncbi:MAG: hypothetical protein AzoDbin1_05130 [Azoarcus sp.]|nr:hypothetical protein [Azoarcus sp.]